MFARCLESESVVLVTTDSHQDFCGPNYNLNTYQVQSLVFHAISDPSVVRFKRVGSPTLLLKPYQAIGTDFYRMLGALAFWLRGLLLFACIVVLFKPGSRSSALSWLSTGQNPAAALIMPRAFCSSNPPLSDYVHRLAATSQNTSPMDSDSHSGRAGCISLHCYNPIFALRAECSPFLFLVLFVESSSRGGPTLSFMALPKALGSASQEADGRGPREYNISPAPPPPPTPGRGLWTTPSIQCAICFEDSPAMVSRYGD
ncbi:hypothetical protein B0H13DRAFT_1871086 [Mycena leptocephala]|nr:hypothetical protein B0H13DRAFT_1871086 [Mycena leptocephala]